MDDLKSRTGLESWVSLRERTGSAAAVRGAPEQRSSGGCRGFLTTRYEEPFMLYFQAKTTASSLPVALGRLARPWGVKLHFRADRLGPRTRPAKQHGPSLLDSAALLRPHDLPFKA